MCVYCIKVCHGNAPMVTKQIQSMIPISPMFRSQDPRTLVKLYSTKAKLGRKQKCCSILQLRSCVELGLKMIS